MKYSLRFIIPLAVALTLIAYAVIPLVDRLTLKWFNRDLDIRGRLVATTLEDSLAALIRLHSRPKIVALFNRITQGERLFAVGFCDPAGKLIYKTVNYPALARCKPANTPSYVLELPEGALHIAAYEIKDQAGVLGQLVLVHSMNFMLHRSEDSRRYIFYLFAGLGVIVSLITVIIAQVSWRGWVSGLRALSKGEGLIRPIAHFTSPPELKPIVKDLRALIRDIETDRKARDEDRIAWAPNALKEILRRELSGEEVLVISNREPYIHTRHEQHIDVQLPASGVVTALEPIMRACSGTWIAHGGGNADRDVVDKHGRIQVPPEQPAYTLRRVWLSKQEEDGYYYGFSNEGLWPLCHIAHVRPIFRSNDWHQYVAVNRKFAEAVAAEAKTDDPVVLVQDYHFALVPKMIRERLPQATIITFWHIPWPNREAFGICPWREELLDGLLGSSIIGFHTRFHCNNFVDTVDRLLECRVDHDASTISYQGKLTAVNHYPISIEWPSRWAQQQKPVVECRAEIRTLNGLSPGHRIGLGVDRLDYTKGILERLHAVERLLETESRWVGKFSFIQIGAPTRSSIEHYQHFETQVRALAQHINHRFGRDDYQPVILKIEHHGPASVYAYYRAADFCCVSSLHDGMNLVAKEFVAARDDESGVLILSQFTGAARELPEALIINPYNVEQCAAAMNLALDMGEMEQRDRMRGMRGLISEFNIYRWAGRMLIDAARMRQHNRLKQRLREGSDAS
ncbi:MAG: trehalose-6-phosphate synthase [Gammaproteobacteria bacterium]|nr:trehalose-6-phosphate synthase [Gammaproteobacteria bacterium]